MGKPVFALLLALLPTAVSAANYHELFFDQHIDHFDPTSADRFSHRYLLNNASWDGRGQLENGCRGPILLYTGNEGPITAFYDTNGFMIEELAPMLGGLLLFPEQRFYGKSLPWGADSFTPSRLKYLTTAQVLEDYVALLAQIKSVPEAANCPVLAFGGSYGGTLTALLRAAHPASVVGGLAASSELGYYDSSRWPEHGVDEFRFDDIVNADYAAAHPQCTAGIKQVQAALDRADKETLVKQLNLCDNSALVPAHSSLLVYVLENFPQMDYPYAIPPMPASPVSWACDAIVNASRLHEESNGGDAVLIGAARTIMDLFYGSDKCIGNQGVQGPGNTPGDGPGKSSWGYQSCTETLHPFSARGLRNYTFNYDASAKICNQLYNGTVKPDLAKLVTQFGGYNLADGSAGVSHLIWSQGTLDPWHGWFNQIKEPARGSNIYHFLMKGSAHHLDLKKSNPADPPDVTAARKEYIKIFKRWIHEASRAQ